MISLTFPNKSNSNAREVENIYYLLNESKIYNFEQSCTKQEENRSTNLQIKQKREKTKTSLLNRQGNEEPIFPTKH